MHDQGEVPQMKDQGFAVAPGTHTLVGIKKIQGSISFYWNISFPCDSFCFLVKTFVFYFACFFCRWRVFQILMVIVSTQFHSQSVRQSAKPDKLWIDVDVMMSTWNQWKLKQVPLLPLTNITQKTGKSCMCINHEEEDEGDSADKNCNFFLPN